MKIMLVAGARPNFMKIAPIIGELKAKIKEFQEKNKVLKYILLHTGQHYDEKMSKTFFDELEIPEPDMNLGVGSGSQAEQIGNIMIRSEKVFFRENPDLVVVVGDVNSTAACSLAAAKIGIPVAHVEAGLRSFDRSMPEEINRIVTDRLSDFLFTTSKYANQNLIKEGIEEDKIFFVGNIMIETLIKNLKKIEKKKGPILKNLKPNQKYGIVTLHRPSNVDKKLSLKKILEKLNSIQKKIKLLFAVHPRTLKHIKEFKFLHYFNNSPNITITEPLGYHDFLNILKNATFVLTDSGGIQEESTYLRIPCLTLRPNTERLETITEGTNKLVDIDNVEEEVGLILEGKEKKGTIPELWDEFVSKRIVKVLLDFK